MIKVLCISHAYVEPYTRVGLLSKEYFENFKLLVVIPKILTKKFREGYKKLLEEGFNVKTVSSIFNFHNSVRIYSFGLLKILKNFKPDIIFVNNEPWSLTAFEVVLFRKILRLKSKLIIYTCENQIRQYPFPFNMIDKYVLKNTNLVLTITLNEGKAVLRKYKKFYGDVEYLPLSVDTQLFVRKKDINFKKSLLGMDENEFVIGYVGRLVYEKGIHLIFYAVKDFDFNYKVLVIGSGPYKKNLETIAKKLGIDKKVIFLEWIRYNQLPNYYNCMDVLVLPSLTTPNWKEQFGRVLIEAMSCEVAVIGSSSGEIPIVIGESVLVFKEGNVNDLKEKLIFLFKNCEMKERFEKKGRKRILENFDRELLNKKTYQIYKSLYESPY